MDSLSSSPHNTRQFRHFPILQELRVVICDCIGHRAYHVAGISPHGQARVLGKSLKWCYPLMSGETNKNHQVRLGSDQQYNHIQTIIKLSSLFWLSEETAIDPTNPLAPKPYPWSKTPRAALSAPGSEATNIFWLWCYCRIERYPKESLQTANSIITEVSECSQLWSQTHPRCFPRKPPHNQTTPPPWCYVPRTSSNFWSHAPWRIAFPTGERIKKMPIQERTTIFANSLKKKKALKNSYK